MIRTLITTTILTAALTGCFKHSTPRVVLAEDKCLRSEMYQSCLLMLPVLLVGDPSNNWSIERCGAQSKVMAMKRAVIIEPACRVK